MKRYISNNDIAFLFKLIGDDELMKLYPSKEKYRQVLKMAWADQLSLEGIGKNLSLTRERARQIYEGEKDKLIGFVRNAIEEYKNYLALKEENKRLEKQIELLKQRFEMLPDYDKKEFEKLSEPAKITLMPIEDLGLSTRAGNVLNFLQVRTIGDLMGYGVKDLLSVRNCGVNTIREFKRILKRHGISIDKSQKFVFAIKTQSFITNTESLLTDEKIRNSRRII